MLDYSHKNGSQTRQKNSTPFGKTKLASSLANPNIQNNYCKKEEESKEGKILNANSSTLSLHINAYENSMVAISGDTINGEKDETNKKKRNTSSIKNWKTVKKILNDSSVKNAYELPRQQQDQNNDDPEVMQFKASQRLSNINQPHPAVFGPPPAAATDTVSQQSPPPTVNPTPSSSNSQPCPLNMPENDDVNEKESLLAGTSFSGAPTLASANMTNEFFKFHVDITTENGHDDIGKQRGLVGLYNQGNSCYMNAAVQALSNCPPLREYFRSYLPSVSKDRNTHINDLLTIRRPISDAFQDLILRIWSDKKVDAIRPTLFLYKIKDRCSQFKGYTQQDAQEFIRCFLDVLHQELRHPITPILDENNKRDEKQLESRNSVSSSCSSSQDELNSAQGDRFETADSGLSSDTGEPSKHSKISAGIPLPTVQEKPKIAKKREQKTERKNQTQFRSIITDVFDGEIISTVKCMTCQHLSNTRETFQDISLSIPTLEQIAILRESPSLDFEASGEEMNKKIEEEDEETEEAEVKEEQPTKQGSFALRVSHNSYAFWAYALAKSWLIDPWLSYIIYFYRFMFAENISLEDCLYAFFSADHLHGDDMYSCEKCSKLRNGVKQCRLTRLPEILCIHLKRFRHEYTYNTKVGTRVIFPLCDLDMKPFMLKSALEQAEQEDKSTLYDLVAFVSHRGAGVEFGHYVAYCYNSIDGNWYEYDDACVTKVEDAEVLSREAYVLFYQKQSTEASEAFKEKVLELSATLNEENNSTAFYISAEWLYRFRTFSEPGPITNSDFLCEHFGQAPLLQPNQVFPVPAKVWSLLFEEYNGGPPCDRLMPCNTCHNRVIEIVSRKTREKNAYLSLEKKLRYVTILPSNVIAYSWYEQWESFVTQFDRAPPGPIRNEALLQKQRDGSMRLRSGINYKTVTREQWTYLHSIYGGGPEVLRTFDKQLSAEEIQSIIQRFEAILAAAERKAKEPIIELPSSDNEIEDDQKPVKDEEEEDHPKTEEEEKKDIKSSSNIDLSTDLKIEENSDNVEDVSVTANTE